MNEHDSQVILEDGGDGRSQVIHLWVLQEEFVFRPLSGALIFLVSVCQGFLAASLLFGPGKWMSESDATSRRSEGASDRLTRSSRSGEASDQP